MPAAMLRPVCPEDRPKEVLGGLALWSLDPRVGAAGVAALFPDPARPSAPAGATLLKSARQRHVCRVPLGEGTAIAKLFPLRSPLSWPRWRKFALAEFVNMREAARRGAPAPRALAFLNYRRWGLVRSTGLLMEDLPGWTDLRAVARTEGTAAACDLAAPILRRLSETGCLHADARDENLLVSPDRTRAAVIDWQYASFAEPRAPWSLEHLVAYYIRKSEELRDAADVARALDRLSGGDTALAGRVRRLLARPPSLRRRLACAPAP